MNSTPTTKDVLIANADEELARVREQIASADEEIARVTERISRMERDDTRDASAGPTDDAGNPPAGPADDARNPPAGPDPQPPQGRSTGSRSIELLPIALLFAACVVVAAFGSYLFRDGITLIAARWAPQRVSTPFSQPTDPPLSAQPGPSVELATAEAAAEQAAPLARTGPQDAAPAAAGIAELIQLQQATARDVANLKREIEQLKAKQDQTATDNSNAIGQLRARQEDMARLLAKVSEQSALPRTSPPSAGPPQQPQARIRPLPPPPRRQFQPRWQPYDDEW
jgi:hypothetical protein